MTKSSTPTLVPKPDAPQSPDHLQEQIRQRAYQLYEERGRDDGHDWQDWFKAQSEIASKDEKIAA